MDEADLLHANPPQHTINIPPFTKSELQTALRRLRKHKSADPRGVELEMLYHAPDELLDYVLELYNDLLRTGRLDPSWQHTLFTMLPKKGDRSRPSNWRPIASLKVLYKVFSKMVHARLQHVLDPQQSFDQTGFRQHTGVEHALCVFDNVCARSLEYNCEIWVASIDLRKAFDRIHHPALFRALRHQGVSEGYLQLLQELYSSQTGSVSDSRRFHIGRGVKQGDIISPLLFNAGLEHAIREWKACLHDEGIHIGAPANLTNIRYADDLMLYAKTWQELVRMLERLKAVLANIGLELNADKTRIITTASETNVAYIDVDGDMVQVLTDIETHMYLGRKIPADLRRCSVVEVAHRINAAWGKFNKFRYVLTNRHVSIKGRLQLFNAVITPTILFGLGSLPLTKRQLEEIDALQRKMLRSIVGWYRVEGEAWSDTMRRMKSRVQSALRQSPVTTWSEVYRRTQHSFGARIVKQNAWPLFAASWDPTRHNNFATQPKRKPGRPPKRWDDDLKCFSRAYFPLANTWHDVADSPEWYSLRHCYIQFCKDDVP